MSIPDININLHPFKCDADCERMFNFFDQVFSGAFMLISILISLYFANKHLTYYSNPFFQDKIISMIKFYYILIICFSHSIYGSFLCDYLVFWNSLSRIKLIIKIQI